MENTFFEISPRRIKALLVKELKDLLKNVNYLVMAALPLVICIIYTQIFKGMPGNGSAETTAVFVLNLCLSMNLVLVSAFIIGMSVAEEKEKNTLRTLMLSAVTPFEFFLSKGLITLVITVITNTIMYFVVGLSVSHLPFYLFVTTLCSLCLIELGAVIGIVSKNQMATGTNGMPLYFIFLFIPIFASINKVFESIAIYLPTYNLSLLLERDLLGSIIKSTPIFNFSVILIWIVLSGIIFAYFYKKKGLD